MTTRTTTHTPEETNSLAQAIGQRLKGGEVLEFISDLGGGKTTFVRGLAHGFGSVDPVASPTFTLNNVYSRTDGKQMYHFDFYRLSEAGVVVNELAEVIGDPEVVTVVEWGEIVHDVLPEGRVAITIESPAETERVFTFSYPKKYSYLFDKV